MKTYYYVRKILTIIFLPLLLLVTLGCSSQDEPYSLRIGHTAPDFATKDLDGNVVILSNGDGGPILLRFFETTCRFCKADTVVFKDFYQKYGSQGLQVFYVGSFYDDKASLKAFVQEHGIAFPVIADQKGVLADLYEIKSYPQTILMGPKRKLEGALLGGVGSAEINEIIGQYL